MKKYLIVLILISFWNNVNAQDKWDSDKISLQQVWKEVDLRNKQLKLEDFSRKQADTEIQMAKDKKLPSIAVLGTTGVNTNLPIYNKGLFSSHDSFTVSRYTYSLGYLLDFDLYDGGKKNRNVEIKKLESARYKNEYDMQRINIRYAAAVIYYDLYKFEQFKQFTESEIETEKKQLATVESLFKNGIVLKSDVLRINVKISQLELTRSEIEKKIIIAKQRLNILMGKESDAPISAQQHENIDILQFSEKSSYIYFVNIAVNRAPDFKISENEYEISNLQLKQVKSHILPKVSFYSNYSYNYPQSSFYPYSQNLWGFVQTGIKVSMSLDKLYTNKHAIESAAHLNAQQIQKMEIKKDEIMVNIREAYLQKEQAFEAVKTAEQNIMEITETVRIIRSSYINQESLLTDLLDAENLLLEAKFALTSAQINVVLSHLRLLAKTGII